jgi:hypothetical protein
MFRVPGLRKFIGLLALLALITQLALSFGHVHFRKSEAPSLASVGHSGDPRGEPSGQPDHRDHDGDFCSICATQALLAAGQPGSAPSAFFLAVFTDNAWFFSGQNGAPNQARIAFHSRAPPL